MRSCRSASTMLAGLLAVLLLSAGSMLVTAHARETPNALAADHVIACIQTAVAV